MKTGVRTILGTRMSTGKEVDILMPEGNVGERPAVLLWHGAGTNERDRMRVLGLKVAEKGVVVFLPDWDPYAEDLGRSDLFASIAYVRDHATKGLIDHGRIVLAGWSRGGRAAAGLVLNPLIVGGWRPCSLVGIASRFDSPSPTSGSSPIDDVKRGGVDPNDVWLVHGDCDPVVEPSASERFEKALIEAGWPVRMVRVQADHAGIVGLRYDEQTRRSVETDCPSTLAAVTVTAHVLASAEFGERP